MAGEHQRNDCKRMVEPEHGTHRQGRGREFGRAVDDAGRRGKPKTIYLDLFIESRLTNNISTVKVKLIERKVNGPQQVKS